MRGVSERLRVVLFRCDVRVPGVVFGARSEGITVNEDVVGLLERIADALEIANQRRVLLIDRVDQLLEHMGAHRTAKDGPLKELADCLAAKAQAEDESERFADSTHSPQAPDYRDIAKESFQAGAAWQRGRGA